MSLKSSSNFDVIVVGGGHAGIEACLASARLGRNTLLITSNRDRIGYMSCNPSIGGLANGHMVRELDVLGGQMGEVADETCIQFKRLNSSRGPAVRGTRVQSDKVKYSRRMSQIIANQRNLMVIESEVKSLILEGDCCRGVVLPDQSHILGRVVVLTTGTFMNGVMHFGLKQLQGGRIGDGASIGLSDQLKAFGLNVQRLKTGTPARLHKDSIDWSKTAEQFGDSNFYPFSFNTKEFPRLPQVACYLSRTTEETHKIIRDNLDKSPMFCGVIEGIGPRYCPSIEDKIHRFADRDSHQTFLEPESLESDLIYLQGISTSLPEDVQDRFLKTIPGLENVKVVRYGYAVEYDYFEPTQLEKSLASRAVSGLFMAGQINGTSGYEEAAVQGFLAGVNADKYLSNTAPLILGRDQAYMGVLMDDLVTKGTREPYRMFTSRAEHRLVLREDNTIDRLAIVAMGLGLLSERQVEALVDVKSRRAGLLSRLKETRITPTQETQDKIVAMGSAPLLKSTTLEEFLRRPEVSTKSLNVFIENIDSDPNVIDAVEIQVKYSGYIHRQNELIQQAKSLENFLVPKDIKYAEVKGLSNEECEKLIRVKPLTLGQAQRISGVNPSAIQAIIVHVKGRKNVKELSVEREH